MNKTFFFTKNICFCSVSKITKFKKVKGHHLTDKNTEIFRVFCEKYFDYNQNYSIFLAVLQFLLHSPKFLVLFCVLEKSVFNQNLCVLDRNCSKICIFKVHFFFRSKSSLTEFHFLTFQSALWGTFRWNLEKSKCPNMFKNW